MKRINAKLSLGNLASGQLQIFSIFQVLFQTYLGRICLFVPNHDRNWTVLFPPAQNLQPYHFAEYYGKGDEWGVHVQNNFKILLRNKRPFISRFGGYVDFYCPFMVGNRCEGFFISGPVLEKCPTPESLRGHWKNLTQSEGSDLNPDFLHYVRMTLNTPILDQKGLKGYLRLVELFALWFSEAEVPGIIPELNHMKASIFSRQIPHPYWVDWAIGMDKFFTKPETGYVLPEWVREELGINQMPTVVAALMPEKPGIQTNTLDVLCQARKFQHECYLAAQDIPDTTSRPLGDYGMTILTSGKPESSPSQSRMEIKEKIQSLCQALKQRLHVNVLAGIGSIIPGGENLARSFKEAVTSLHMAVREGKTTFFSNDLTLQRETSSASELRDLLKNFSESLALSSPARLILARERFINQLLYNGYGPEITRAYLLSALNMLMEPFEKRLGMAPADAKHLGANLINRLDSAHTLPDMVSSFRGVVDSLLWYQKKPRAASVSARLNSIIEEIRRDPGRAWRLSSLSKQADLSNPTFLKWFQKVAGLSFGTFVRQVRLSKAKDLLRESHLTLEHIAQECGFSSSSSFSQVFRKAQGMPPGQFRFQNEKNR